MDIILVLFFSGCSSLSDIKVLKIWNISNGNNFTYMFNRCSLLSDIRGLINWNVSNGNIFSHMFKGCSSLSDLKGLENWNVLKGNNFSYKYVFRMLIIYQMLEAYKDGMYQMGMILVLCSMDAHLYQI